MPKPTDPAVLRQVEELKILLLDAEFDLDDLTGPIIKNCVLDRALFFNLPLAYEYVDEQESHRIVLP